MILRNCRFSCISYWSQSFRNVSVPKFIQGNSSLISFQYKRLNTNSQNNVYMKGGVLLDRNDHTEFNYASKTTNANFLTTFERNERRFNLGDLFDKNFLSKEEWSSLINEKADTLGGRFNKEVFDTFILQKCLTVNNVELAMSYLNYTSLEKVNFLALSYCLRVLGKNINSDRSQLFLDVYQYLNKDPIQPTLIIENIIQALCLTNYWKLAVPHINYLEMNKEKFKYKEIHNYLTRALIKNVSWKEGMDYLTIKKLKFSLACLIEEDTVTEVLYSICHNPSHDQKKEQLMLFFKYLQNFQKSFNDLHADIVCSMGGENLLSIKKLNIANGKCCQSCGGSLDHLPVDEALIFKLKGAVESSIVRGPNIFNNTTPEEWRKFNEFLENKGPFNVVVDGLNLLFKPYSDDDPRRSNKDIAESINFLIENYKNVLILSRKHSMHRFEKIKRLNPKFFNLKTFYLDDITKDDVFVIYAALHSGWGCHVLTRDYLRNYKDKLYRRNPGLAERFFHWQSMHQLLIEPGPSNKYFKPYQYHRVPQYNNVAKSWHIPVQKHDDDLEYFTHQEEWICIRDLQEGEAIVGTDSHKIERAFVEKNFGEEERVSVANNTCNNFLGDMDKAENIKHVKSYDDYIKKKKIERVNKFKVLLHDIYKDFDDSSVKNKTNKKS